MFRISRLLLLLVVRFTYLVVKTAAGLIQLNTFSIQPCVSVAGFAEKHIDSVNRYTISSCECKVQNGCSTCDDVVFVVVRCQLCVVSALR